MPHDSGPIYIETNLARWPAEPWNAASNLAFLAIFAWWAWRTRGRWKQQRIIVACLPVLFVGWVGGTVYHANRSSDVWLLMDFLPIATLAFAVSCAYWLKLLGSPWKVLAVAVLPFGAVRVGAWSLPVSDHARISAGYAAMAIGLAAPLSIQAWRTRNPAGRWLVWAMLSFGVALAFRFADRPGAPIAGILPMGSHWLWHLFGALATQFTLEFVYLDSEPGQ